MTALRAFVLFSLAGCQTQDFSLLVDRSTYLAGETMTLRLESHVLEAARYNLCFVEFVPKLTLPQRACSAEAQGLPAFGAGAGQAATPTDAAEGNYRLQTTLELVDSRRVIVVESDAFAITH